PHDERERRARRVAGARAARDERAGEEREEGERARQRTSRRRESSIAPSKPTVSESGGRSAARCSTSRARVASSVKTAWSTIVFPSNAWVTDSFSSTSALDARIGTLTGSSSGRVHAGKYQYTCRCSSVANTSSRFLPVGFAYANASASSRAIASPTRVGLA